MGHGEANWRATRTIQVLYALSALLLEEGPAIFGPDKPSIPLDEFNLAGMRDDERGRNADEEPVFNHAREGGQ